VALSVIFMVTQSVVILRVVMLSFIRLDIILEVIDNKFCAVIIIIMQSVVMLSVSIANVVGVSITHRHKRIHRLLIGPACLPCFG